MIENNNQVMMQMAGLDCIVVGDVFSDITVEINSDAPDLFSGGTSYCNSIRMTLGGSGNVAVGLSILGGKAAHVGKAGNDLTGKLYVRNLKDNRVVPRIFLDKHLPTGLTITFVDKGERSFLVSRGANDNLATREIKQIEYLIKSSRFFYCCGFSLVHPTQKAAVLEALRLAKKSQVRTVFDPGAYNLVNQQKKLFLELTESCDVLSLNLREAQALTNKIEIEDVIDRLRQGNALTALKCGESGSFLVNKEEAVRTRAFPIKCVDSTGAGDAFTSALIFGLSNGLTLESTGKLANWFAGWVSHDFGARSYPSRHEVKRLLMMLKRNTGSTKIIA